MRRACEVGYYLYKKYPNGMTEAQYCEELAKYTITNGAGKFAPDWTQICIYTRNWGGEYWLLRRGV